MRGLIIYERDLNNERDPYLFERMKIHATKFGMEITLIYEDEIDLGIEANKAFLKHKDEEVRFPEFAVLRTKNTYIAKYLEEKNILTINNSHMMDTFSNKINTHQFFNVKGVSMTDMIFLKKEWVDFEREYRDYPYVVKSASGARGEQVYLVNQKEDLVKAIEQIKGSDILIQKKFGVHGKDLRVTVMGNRIIGCVNRISKGDFRANYSLGGMCTKYDLDEKGIQFVHKIIDAYGGDLGFVGIDLLYDESGGLILNEINTKPDMKTFYLTHDFDPMFDFLKYISEKLNKNTMN